MPTPNGKLNATKNETDEFIKHLSHFGESLMKINLLANTLCDKRVSPAEQLKILRYIEKASGSLFDSIPREYRAAGLATTLSLEEEYLNGEKTSVKVFLDDDIETKESRDVQVFFSMEDSPDIMRQKILEAIKKRDGSERSDLEVTKEMEHILALAMRHQKEVYPQSPPFSQKH